jgi:hypothetical protein
MLSKEKLGLNVSLENPPDALRRDRGFKNVSINITKLLKLKQYEEERGQKKQEHLQHLL